MFTVGSGGGGRVSVAGLGSGVLKELSWRGVTQ